MARPLTVGLCSTPTPPAALSPLETRDWNLAEGQRLVAEATGLGAEIVCLPETFSTFGSARSLPVEDLPGGETGERCAALARRHAVHVVAPLAGLFDGVPRNAALWFDRKGDYRGAYFKVHLTTPELELGLVPGDEWPVFEIECARAGTVRVGVFTCFDVNFPEAARLLAMRGAEILFHPTVYSMYGEAGWEAVLRARAIDNCVYVCTVNHGVREDEPWMPGMALGRTGVVGPDGLTLAEGGRYAGVVMATIDLARRRKVRAFGVGGDADFRDELWRHRRPETYTEIATRGVYAPES
ncbi:MAG TPA: carbon-nitrogen hydrolase family protein [Chloroflexota bacterium]|nr:carbon-nitrogen hydrolase family protein [Chloroflexota bacterium]